MQHMQLQGSHLEFTTLMYFGATVVKTIPMCAHWVSYHKNFASKAYLRARISWDRYDIFFPHFKRAWSIYTQCLSLKVLVKTVQHHVA